LRCCHDDDDVKWEEGGCERMGEGDGRKKMEQMLSY
jgi:hypothetical protein